MILLEAPDPSESTTGIFILTFVLAAIAVKALRGVSCRGRRIASGSGLDCTRCCDHGCRWCLYSYWLGRHYSERLRSFWPFDRHPEWLSHGENFFRRHGGKSVVFGRFVGPVRAIIPVVAGMVGMRPVVFVGVNVLSAFAWFFLGILEDVVTGDTQRRTVAVIRLWSSSVMLDPDTVPLWVGYVSMQVPRRILFLRLPVTAQEYDMPLEQLMRSLNGIDQRVVGRSPGAVEGESRWNGSVLLLRSD